MENNQVEYTYFDQRHCELPSCSKPIPDQAHGNRKFCERKVLPDGSIENHKDDFHSKIRQRSEEIECIGCVVLDNDNEDAFEINNLDVLKRGDKLTITLELPVDLNSGDSIAILLQ